MPPPAPARRKRALITGITGQDGSYLAELLLAKDYEVWGMVRRSSLSNTERIEHLPHDPHDPSSRLRFVHGDLGDGSSVHRILQVVQPDEIYNLAAQTHVQVSFEIPEYTSDITALGPIRLLEGMHELKVAARFLQASSSEMFGNAGVSPQNESTPLAPRSPYATAKAHAYYATRNYRDAYGMFAANAIMFNHESPRRGDSFVTRKISRAAARIKAGQQERLYLGNLNARRDWGFAGDYAEAMWRIMQQDAPDDYVIATGESHSVREFCEVCFAGVGLPLRWEGEGLAERGIDADGRTLVEIDAEFLRPIEVDALVGDATKAREQLGWQPTVGFADLARMMVQHDLQQAEGGC